MSADELNAAVTAAISEAENHDYEGAKLWQKVAECELAIVRSNDPEISPVEREIAERGVVTATEKAMLLRRVALRTER